MENFITDPNAQIEDGQGAFIPNEDVSGGTPMADDTLQGLVKRVAALEERDGVITDALVDVADGKYQGADGVAGLAVALRGGQPIDVSKVQPNVNPH